MKLAFGAGFFVAEGRRRVEEEKMYYILRHAMAAAAKLRVKPELCPCKMELPNGSGNESESSDALQW